MIMKIKMARKKKCCVVNLADEIEKVFDSLNSTLTCDDYNKQQSHCYRNHTNNNNNIYATLTIIIRSITINSLSRKHLRNFQ